MNKLIASSENRIIDFIFKVVSNAVEASLRTILALVKLSAKLGSLRLELLVVTLRRPTRAKQEKKYE